MKKSFKMATTCAVFGATALLSACTNHNNANYSDLVGHRFVLVAVNDMPLLSVAPPVIEFSSEVQSTRLKVLGKMCNDFSGPANYNQNILQADGLVMTRAICDDLILNKLDVQITQMFIQGINVKIVADKLVLKSGNTTLTYKQEDIKS